MDRAYVIYCGKHGPDRAFRVAIGEHFSLGAEFRLCSTKQLSSRHIAPLSQFVKDETQHKTCNACRTANTASQQKCRAKQAAGSGAPGGQQGHALAAAAIQFSSVQQQLDQHCCAAQSQLQQQYGQQYSWVQPSQSFSAASLLGQATQYPQQILAPIAATPVSVVSVTPEQAGELAHPRHFLVLLFSICIPLL